ncbi:hypothetical protein H0H93_004279 [Arthromyces matolae]|nr:hypothetical protein H0H93_004279 [Arthromyces matolae]
MSIAKKLKTYCAHAGFVKNSKLVPIGYVAQLPHMSSVVARYTTRLKLWVASTSGGATWQPFDGNIQTGQTIDTIQSEAKAVHVWNLADPMDTPDNSQWVLSADDCGNYHIKLKPS